MATTAAPALGCLVSHPLPTPHTPRATPDTPAVLGVAVCPMLHSSCRGGFGALNMHQRAFGQQTLCCLCPWPGLPCRAAARHGGKCFSSMTQCGVTWLVAAIQLSTNGEREYNKELAFSCCIVARKHSVVWELGQPVAPHLTSLTLVPSRRWAVGRCNLLV
jgi:hypothetical protein